MEVVLHNVSDRPEIGETTWQSKSDGNREVTDCRSAITAWVGIAACVVGAAVVLLARGHWPAVCGAMLLAMVPVGAAVMCWIDSGDGFAQAGLTLVLSLALNGIFSALMIWSGAWHPSPMYLVLALGTLASCVARLLVLDGGRRLRMAAIGRDALPQVAILLAGISAWAYGVSQIRTDSIGFYGLLAGADIWFYVGFGILLFGGLLELYRSEPRLWLLCAHLVALVVAIHGTVPILYSVPEYAWVYKHIGVAQLLEHYGRITNPSDIYQQWPVLFSSVAAISHVAGVGPLSFAAWAPLFFELANALLLLGIFRVLGTDRRVTYVALFLYEGLIAWVGQDYLSPQAYSYLLWFGVVIVLIRWLLRPAFNTRGTGSLARVYALIRAGETPPYESSKTQRTIAAGLLAILFLAIVAAHQLTPYIALTGIGVLVLLGLVWRGWQLWLILVAIALGFLAPRYGIISQQFGGIFSGGNALENASGVSIQHIGAQKITGEIVRALSLLMWLGALVAGVSQRRSLGRASITIVLALTPFSVLFAQSYGGEAIYRVYLFSAPWCALLIASALAKLSVNAWHRLVVASTCSLALMAGLQGLYGPVKVDTFTPSELAASLWLFSHATPHSVIVFPDDNFPRNETANYSSFDMELMPSDAAATHYAWLDEGNMSEVERWLKSFHQSSIYVVFSQSMASYTGYFSSPTGYGSLAEAVRGRPGWSAVYRASDVVIYVFK